MTGVQDTIAAGQDPEVIVCNLKGWGMRLNKIWADAAYMTDRADAYFAVFVKNGGTPVLVAGTVKALPYEQAEQELYWYFEHLPVAGTQFDDYAVLEVVLTGDSIQIAADGSVSGYDSLTVVSEGETITLNGLQKGETSDAAFTYTVSYEASAISSESNVRLYTVTNDRPGVILRKTDWAGSPLAGAGFTLSVENGVEIGSFVSDADGLITVAYLSEGTSYVLAETSVPVGYFGLTEDALLSLSQGTLSVSGPDAAFYTLTTPGPGSAIATLTLKNRARTLTLVKRDADAEGQTPLEGVTFALHRQVTVGSVTTIDRLPMPGYEALTTDAEGRISLLNDLPAGTYELRETNALPGYLNLSGHVRFTISETGAVSLVKAPAEASLSETLHDDGDYTAEYVLTIMNRRERKRVEVLKLSMDNHVLEGAHFALYQVEVSGETETLTLLTEAVSGRDGLLSLGELRPGSYRLVETQAPDGYYLLDAPLEITVTEQEVLVTLRGESVACSVQNVTDMENWRFTVRNSSGY